MQLNWHFIVTKHPTYNVTDPNFNPIPNFNPNPYRCMWKLFSGVTNFPLHRYSIYPPQTDRRLS